MILVVRINILKMIGLSKVRRWMDSVGPKAAVVGHDDRVEERGEHNVGLGVRSVHADTGVGVLHPRLDDVLEGGAEGGGLPLLDLLHHIIGEGVLEEGVAGRVSPQLADAVLAVLDVLRRHAPGNFAGRTHSHSVRERARSQESGVRRPWPRG